MHNEQQSPLLPATASVNHRSIAETEMDNHYYTVSEVADLLKVSTSTVRRAVAGGHLSTTRVGSRRQIRIGQGALAAYLEETVKNEPAIERAAEIVRVPEVPGATDVTIDQLRGVAPTGATWRIVHADVLAGLRQLESCSVNCIVTSPPYYWQRDYGVRGQIGHEASISGYVQALVDTFAEAKRVVANDGLFFLNLGDTYYSAKGRAHGEDKKHTARQIARRVLRAVDGPGLGLPRKSLIGIPWRVALALQQVGWTLRSAIIWHRPGSLPEPTSKDRSWRTHEYIFMFAKQPRYWFDRSGLRGSEDVWTLDSRPENPGSHFAAYPVELVDRCLSIGCIPGGVVLDPFVGSGTTMVAALRRGMSAVGIELNREYCEFSARRLAGEFKAVQLGVFAEQRRA